MKSRKSNPQGQRESISPRGEGDMEEDTLKRAKDQPVNSRNRRIRIRGIGSGQVAVNTVRSKLQYCCTLPKCTVLCALYSTVQWLSLVLD